MIRAKTLHRRPVVDLDAAEKLGHVEEVVLDPGGGHLAGFLVSEGRAIGAGGRPWVVPAAAIHAIGPDALTIRRADDASAELPDADALPRLSHLVGKKMISRGGEVLGTIDDVIVDEASGRILAYAFHRGSEAVAGLGNLLSANRQHALEYLRTGTGLRVGEALIVVPDDAVIDGSPDFEPAVPATGPTDERIDWSAAPTDEVGLRARAVGEPAGPDEITRRIDWDFEPADRDNQDTTTVADDTVRRP